MVPSPVVMIVVMLEWLSGPDEHRIRAGVDDEPEPGGVSGLPGRLPGPGAGDAHGLAGEELLVQLLHEDAGRLLAHRPQARDECRGTRIEEGLIGGEELILNPPADLKDGTKIQVVK